MNLILILNLWIFICSLIGSIYGIYHFYVKRSLFTQMATCSILCLMFARLFQVVYLIAQGNLNIGFHVGILGIIGSFMFLFSASYGQLDSLVDDGSRSFLKIRILSLTAPLIILLTYIYLYLNVSSIELRIVWAIVALFIMQCSYYNFKHIIIYDVEYGIIYVIKKYNILALIYALLTMLEAIGLYTNIIPLYIASCIGIGIVALILLPILKGGVAKWSL